MNISYVATEHCVLTLFLVHLDGITNQKRSRLRHTNEIWHTLCRPDGHKLIKVQIPWTTQKKFSKFPNFSEWMVQIWVRRSTLNENQKCSEKNWIFFETIFQQTLTVNVSLKPPRPWRHTKQFSFCEWKAAFGLICFFVAHFHSKQLQ